MTDDTLTVTTYVEIGLNHLARLQHLHCHETTHQDQPRLDCEQCQAAHQVRTALQQALAAAVPPPPRPREGVAAHGRAERV